MFMSMIMKSLSNPSTGKMLTGKMKEMYKFLGEQFQCDPKEVGLFLKLEDVKVKIKKEQKGADGKTLLGEDGKKLFTEELVMIEETDSEGKVVMIDAPSVQGENTGTEVVVKKIAKMIPKTEEKAIIYVYVHGKPVQQIAIEQFLALATKGVKE